MSNSFVTVKNIARQALPRLIEQLVFPNLVHRDFSDDFQAGRGATVLVRKPVMLTAQEFSGSVSAQDVNEQSVEVVLDKLATVDVAFSAMERATTAADLNRLFIEPAAVALAQKINADGLSLLSGVTNVSEGDPSKLSLFADAAKALNNANVPMSPRRAVWSADAEATFRSMAEIVNAEKSGSTQALREGSIGRIFGIDNYMAQGVDSSMLGCVFHPYAFAFVTRPLAAPASAESYTTGFNGITLRVTRGYDMNTKKEMCSMDVLYGYKLMDPALAVKVVKA